jgi:predicted heme/steroid binding protein
VEQEGMLNLWLHISAALTCGFAVLMVSKRSTVNDAVNKIAMRFFRDLSRYKARKRLYGGNPHALALLLLGREEPYQLNDNDHDHQQRQQEEEDQDSTLLRLTRDELSTFRGQTEDTPIYLSIQQRIYDVSANRKFYGPQGNYHLFVGTDATRAYATGCLVNTPSCITSDTDGLSEQEYKEIQRWVELYDTHDKYQLVGYLLLEDDDEEEEEYRDPVTVALNHQLKEEENESENIEQVQQHDESEVVEDPAMTSSTT